MIATQRLFLRPLRQEDATQRYLDWFRGPASERIYSSDLMNETDDLRRYIAERQAREDVLFLGIFERTSGDHIGNLKYEPISEKEFVATMGIFIGEPSARGKGIAGEAIQAANSWLKDRRRIRKIVLGVETNNIAAIRAYEKIGFLFEECEEISPSASTLSMVLTL
ncbi:acetyltransferase, ribosomal protein N-acetylase [Rhizobium leguminosarum bv. trifolii WSM2297]|uniref:Acetyltransferase, ribosomal protein N-acetylase n=1 Tax=Rhizobium leguminosarum bv. trifolii WSM2297 TaxID=754762 RepID=J0CGT5_RHILT|nr:GNAT family protein [Rhizobium leguminosarum]EJC82697.1 acetyltransferase, ribosomal protein N-acetylase [Rhizobium leguminosarum bv. trifolii WSM2297]